MTRKKDGRQERQDNQAEARRILDRVGRESESGSVIDRQLGRARDHFAAQDADGNDRIELWGTRIGRALAFTVLLVLILWLIVYITGG